MVESNGLDRPVVASDDGNAAWVRDDAVPGGGALVVGRISLFHAVVKNAATTVTVDVTGGSFIEAVVFEYAGIDRLHPVDSVSTMSGDSPLPAEGGPFATHWPGELVLNVLVVLGAMPASDPGFVTRSNFDGDLFQDLVLAVPGSVRTAPGAASSWVSMMVGYRPAGAAAPDLAHVVQRAAGSIQDGGDLLVSFLEPVASGSTLVAALEWSPPSSTP